MIIIDSITHLWDSCKNAFTGKLTKIGTIPLNVLYSLGANSYQVRGSQRRLGP